MKKLLLLVSILTFMQISFAQQWKKNLPAKKDGNVTFFDYQKAFNEYAKAYEKEHELNPSKNIKEQEHEGEEIPGFEQFKRWEYYWKTRVDNVTGEFPKTTAWEVWQDYKKTLPNIKSQSGTWVSLGPANLDRENDGANQENGTGRLNCMAFDPNDDNHFWVGAPAGGVWETTDGGSAWACITDDNPIIGVSAIALPSDYNKTTNPTIYIATGDRDAVDDPSIGVLKTTDGGATWNTTGLTFSASANTRTTGLVCSESDPNLIVASSFKGIYRSTDAGANWTLMQTGLFMDMDKIPGTNTIVATTISSVEAWRSTDFGSTWTNVWTGIAGAGGEYRVDVAATDASTGIVYIISSYYDTDALYGIYKSTDAGASFNKVYDALTSPNLFGWTTNDDENDGGQGWYDIAFAVSNTDADVVYVGGVNGWISTNGATSFTNCNIWTDSYGTADEVHADHHNAYFHPNTNRLFDVNDGGVYYCDNVILGSSSIWTSVTDGIVTGQIYDIGVSQDVEGYIVAGFQDNGTKLMEPTDNAYGWEQVKAGDGMCCDIDPTNSATQWGTYTNLQVDQTTNLWVSASSIRNSGSAAWAGPLEADPQGGALYIGTDAVETKSVAKDGKPGPPSGWTDLSGTLDGTNYLSALDIYNDGTNKMIWTASPSGCWKSPLGGSGTYTLLSNLPSDIVTDIAIDENDYKHVYVCFGGYDNINVYETTDNGANWTDISDGLPAVPTGAIVINENNTTDHEVYVGTDAGIYVKLGSAPWQLFNSGMPFVSITDMEIYYGGATPEIYVSTYGRGVWKGDCYDPPVLDLAIGDIIEPVTTYCTPGTYSPTAQISNIGTTAITSATIEYSIDGGIAVSTNWSGSLAQGASDNVTFPAVALSFGSHTIEFTIVSRNGSGTDEASSNDVMSKIYTLSDNSLPYIQNFDNFTTQTGAPGTTFQLDECWNNDPLDSSPNLDFGCISGSTPSGGTGPSYDHTSGTGKYLFTETSSDDAIQKTANLLSPTFDLTNYTSTSLSFWYHMYGDEMGDVQVDLYYDGSWHTATPVNWGSTGSTTTTLSGNQGDSWYEATADISAGDGYSDFQVRISFTTGAKVSATNFYMADFAVDDFFIDGTSAASCTEPTTQASNFSAVAHETSLDLSWLRGDGDKVIILVHEAAAVNSDPVSGTSYTANAAFGSGTQIGTGNYVVYDGTGTNVTVTGLTANTEYYFSIYEYNSTDVCYLIPGLTGNKYTLPAQPSAITGSTTPCDGSSQTYSVTNVSGITYTWAFPAGWTITAGQGTNSVTVTVGSTSGNATVTPSNTSGNGTAQTLAITVSPLPTAATSVSASPSSITSGNSSTLSYTGGSGTTFEWYSGSCGGTSVGSGNNVSVSPTSTTTYYGRWENGCGVSACQSVTVTVTTNPPIITNVSPDNFFKDKGASITIDGTDLGGATNVNIAGINASSITSNIATQIVAVFGPGVYSNNTLTVTTGGGSDTYTMSLQTRNIIPVGGGTDSHATIQSALDGLAAWYTTDAFNAGQLPGTKTIDVYNGTYTEKVTPDVNLGTTASERLVIQNHSGEQPVVDASGLTNAFYIGALDYVTVSGFTAHSSTDAVIYTEGDNNVIEYNKCYGSATGAGIILNNAITTTVQNNPVYNNNTFGIRLIASNNAVIKNNTIANNGNEAKAPPLPSVYTPAQLYVESGTGVSVSNNIIFAKSGTNVFTLLTESGITVSSDYNTYFKNGNTSLVYYNGTVYADLAAWNGNGAGTNDIETNPDFVNTGTDFHIKSSNGSYPYPDEWPPEAAASAWNNDASTSPALDAGNPGDAYANEPVSGGRINQGAYGNTAQASKSAGLIWDGSTSIDWQTTTNWTPEQIPTSTDDIIIPDGMSNYPVVDDGTTTAVCNNMTIDANANITIATNGQMTASGSITNNAGAAGLIVKSDVTGDGSLIVNNSPAATVERFVTGNQWHMMFPALDAVPKTTYTTEGSDINYNFYSYNEPNEDYWDASAIYSVTGWTSEVGAGNIRTDKGYLFNRYNLGDKTFVQTGGNLSSADKTFDVSYTVSTVAIGNGVTQARKYFDGWNLAGNPFTCSVDWDQVTLNGIESGVYYFNGTNYIYYMQGGDGSQNPPYDIGLSLNGGSQYIPSGQGFMVKVANVAVPVSGTDDINTTFTIPASAGVHNSVTYYKNKKTGIPNYMKLEIEKDSYTDEMIVRTLPTDVTEGHDSKYDAYKMFAWDHSKPQLYSADKNNAIYAINSVPEITDNKVIPLGIYIGIAGQYQINTIENNFSEYNVFLHDISKDSYLNLTNNPSYYFDTETGTINNRFELVFEKSSLNLESIDGINVFLFPNPNNGSFYLTVNKSIHNYKVEITTVTGQLIYQNKVINSGTAEIKFNPVANGIYFVKIILENNKTINKKIVID